MPKSELWQRLWNEITSDPPRLRRPRSWGRLTAGVFGVIVVVCCGWLALSTLTGIASDLAIYLVPAGVLAAVVAGLVMVWRLGWLRRWRPLAVIGLGLVLVVLVPAGLGAGWLLRETAKESVGAHSPSEAVYAWSSYGPVGYPWVRDDRLFERSLCDSNRLRLRQQADELGRLGVAGQRRGNVFEQALLSGVQEVTRDGPTAVLRGEMEWIYAPDPASDDGWSYVSEARTWTFTVVEGDGWYVCQVEAVNPCETSAQGPRQVNCDPAPATPVPATSAPAREWDAGGVSWRCFPDAPDSWKWGVDCEIPDGWQQPGPYACAPDYPLPRSEATVRACHRLGFYYVT